ASPSVETRYWTWRGYKTRYTCAGLDTKGGPAIVLVHGFGGNADHWAKNVPVLGAVGPTYAIDLLGYGFSDKPDPGPWEEKNLIYNFENWAEQIKEFVREVVVGGSTDGVFLACNSVGGVAG
ncbi:unnamed protein product, partial [Phaeothamnion confervicola]